MDGDTQFEKESVDKLRFALYSDISRKGAACGRIYPISESAGKIEISLMGKEEILSFGYKNLSMELDTGYRRLQNMYSEQFCVLLGASLYFDFQHCIGTLESDVILTSFRSAGENWKFSRSSVLETYSVGPSTASEVLKFDQGEDRMLSTLLISKGWTIVYVPDSSATTYCPETFEELFQQRRRWITSTVANNLHLIGSFSQIVSSNKGLSSLFMIYVAYNLVSSLLTPCTTIITIIGGVLYAAPGLHFLWSYFIGMGIPLFYIIACYFLHTDMMKDSKTVRETKLRIKLKIAFWICLIYCILLGLISVGFAVQISQNPASPTAIFFFSLVTLMLITALLHNELHIVIWGFCYLLLLPTMYLTLVIFAFAQLHDQSWGTREGIDDKNGQLFNWKQIRNCFCCKCKDPDSKEELVEDEVELDFKKKEEKKSGGKGEIVFKESKQEIFTTNDPQESKTAPETLENTNPLTMESEGRRIVTKEKQFGLEVDESNSISFQPRNSELSKVYVTLNELAPRLWQAILIKKIEQKEEDEKIKSLALLQFRASCLLLVVNLFFLILILTLYFHPELKIRQQNVIGLVFIATFEIVIILQFIAMIVSRFNSFLTKIATTTIEAPNSGTFIQTYTKVKNQY